MNEIYVAIIALTGVVFSVLISYFISKRNIDLKLKEIKEDYSKNLHIERIKYYPKLYEITGGIGTLFNSNSHNTNISKNELEEYLNRLVKWDEKYALFGGPLVMEKLFSARRRLEKTLTDPENVGLKELYESLQELEFELKKEIGVFTAERFDTIQRNSEEHYEAYEERFNKYRLIE